MTDKDSSTFEDLLDITLVDLHPIAKRLRQIILELDPNVCETVRLGDKAATYGLGPRKMIEGYAYILPYTKWVNLGFYQGASLDDQSGILEGTGKKLRHVKIRSVEDAERKEIKVLLKEALEERMRALLN